MTVLPQLKKHSHGGTETQRRSVGAKPASLCPCASMALFEGRR
jgi:hypothetical protein